MRNKVEHSRVGIHVNYTTTRGGVVLVRNELPAGVPDNYNPYHVAPPGAAAPAGAGAGWSFGLAALTEQQPSQPHAAIANAYAAVPAAVPAPPASALRLEEKLATLKRLLDRGYLSAEVYAARSAALLDASGL